VQFPDLTKRSNAIAIILGLTIFFFVATFAAYLWPHAPVKLPELCAAAFYAMSQSLMLALKMGGPDAPELPAVTSGSTQTTTTTKAESAASVAPAPGPNVHEGKP
jgi:hypothetical protein